MYLKKSYNRKTGRTQLFIVEAYRDENKRPKTKVVKTLGYLDVLEKEYDDPIAHFTEEARRLTLQRKENIEQIRLNLNPSAVLPTGSSIVRNYGFLAILKILKEIGIDTQMDELASSSKAGHSLAALYQTALCSNILYHGWSPSSQRKLPMSQSAVNITMSDIYRALDLMNRYQDLFLREVFYKLHPLAEQEKTSPFYCYFTEYLPGPDPDSGIDLRKLFSAKSDISFFHALFTDAADLPVTFSLAVSQTPEQKIQSTVEQTLSDSVFREHPLIAVAGSTTRNFAEMIPVIRAQGNGYMFCFPLRYADESLQAFALDPATDFSDAPDPTIFHMPSFDGSIYHSFLDDFKANHLKLAVRTVETTYHDKTSATRGTALEKQIVIYSPSFARRATAQRQEISTAAAADNDLLDGYVVLLSSETSANVLEIGARCLKLVEIADFFRIDIPEHVAAQEHFDPYKMLPSAFFMNYISFLICRILEQKIGYRFTIPQIRDSLAKCDYTNIEGDIYMLNYRDEVLDAIGDALEIDFSRRFRRLADLNRYDI